MNEFITTGICYPGDGANAWRRIRNKYRSLIPKHILPRRKRFVTSVFTSSSSHSQTSKEMIKIYCMLALCGEGFFPECSLYLPLRKRHITHMVCLIIQCVACHLRSTASEQPPPGPHPLCIYGAWS